MDLITFTHKIAMSLHRVGLAGAAVDLKRFHKLGKEWTRSAIKTKDLVVRHALKAGMKEFVPTNDNHIRELLYQRYKLPVLDKTRKSRLPAVDKPALKKLLMEDKENVFIRDLIEFNNSDKLASTWYGRDNGKSNTKPSVKDLIQQFPDEHTCRNDLGLLHFWIFPLRARTGRRSSGGGEEGDPEARNSQNWHPTARGVIVSRWRNHKRPGNIAILDFSRLEVVLMGWRSRDDKLIYYFTTGPGYEGIAKELWGQDVEKDTPIYKATKAIVLGVNYNMQDWKMAHDLWYKCGLKLSSDFRKHVARTGRKRKEYLRMFPDLKRYIRNRIREVTATQQVVSPTGRIRHMPHHGPDSEGFWHIRNAAINYPIQSFASDITGGAIVDYERRLLKEHKMSYKEWHNALLTNPFDPPASPVFNEVHDELDLDLHPKSGKKDLDLLVDCMEQCETVKKLVPGFKLNLKVDVEVIERWR